MKVEYKQIIIDKDWVKDNLVGLEWQRDIYPARVNKFINYIKNGTFRQHSLITLWKDNSNNKLMILDGQHKLKAIIDSDTKILLDLRILSEVDKFEVMQEYKSLANVKHHRIIDIIKLSIFGKKNKYLLKILDEKKFPINVSFNGGRNSIRIDNLLIILFNGQRRTRVRSSLSQEKLEPFIEQIDEKQYKLIEEFCCIYKKCFGDPSIDSWVYKNIIVMTLMKIWLANKESIKEEEIIKAFKRIEQNASIRQDTLLSGVGIGINEMVKKVYKTINYKRSYNKFVIFWDEEVLI